MTEIIVIALAAVVTSFITLISGFGLGTLLTPVFIFFFPVDLAIALTAVVHFLNNVFKFGILFRDVHWKTFLWFGIPGIAGAAYGAYLLMNLSITETFAFAGFETDLLRIIIGVLMIFFAYTELNPKWSNFQFAPKYLIPGGVLSGFFGGLSGHQGALRTMFLIRAGLSKEAFISTGVAIALVVDITRIPVYWSKMSLVDFDMHKTMLIVATLAAFGGAMIGKKLIKKVTFRTVQVIVGLMLIAIGIALTLGLI